MMVIIGIIAIIIKVIFMELMVGRSSGSLVWNKQTLVMWDGVRPAL